MSFKRTIIIAVIFLLLGGFYYFSEIKGKPVREKEKEEKEKKEAVFSIKENDLNKIVLNRQMVIEVKDVPGVPPLKTGNTESFTFKKINGNWKITAPIQASADEDTLNQLAKALTGLKKDEIVEVGAKDLKKYGLDSPQYRITVSDGKKEETIELGDQTIDNRFFISKLASSPDIFRVDTGFKYNLEKQLNDYRNKKIIPLKPEEMAKIILHSGGRTFILERKPGAKEENKAWSLTEPKISRTGEAEIYGFVSDVASLSTKEFYAVSPANIKKYGLKNAPVILEVVPNDKKLKPVILRLGKSDKKQDLKYLLMDGSNEFYGLYNVEVEKLQKKPFDFLNKKLITFNMNSLTTLTALINGQEYVFTKKEETDKKTKKIIEKWLITKPEQKEADTTRMNNALNGLNGMFIQDFMINDKMNLSKTGLDKPSCIITGKRYDGKELFSVSFGGEKKEKDKTLIYTLVKGEQEIVTVDAGPLSMVKGDLLSFAVLPQRTPGN